MKLIERNEPPRPGGLPKEFRGRWTCQTCTSIVEFEDKDRVSHSWAYGRFGEITHAVATCPVCKVRREFSRPAARGWRWWKP